MASPYLRQGGGRRPRRPAAQGKGLGTAPAEARALVLFAALVYIIMWNMGSEGRGGAEAARSRQRCTAWHPPYHPRPAKAAGRAKPIVGMR